MKFLIMPYAEGFPGQAQESEQVSFENLVSALKTESFRKMGQTVELQDDQPVQTQIESTLDNLDLDSIFDPTMLNTGGMEIMATIKRELRLQLETLLFAQKN